MTTNTTPPPPAPVSTFAGVTYDIGELSQEEKALINLRRRIVNGGGFDLCDLDKNSLRVLDRYRLWRNQGPTWLGLVMSDEGIIRFWDGKPSGRIG